MIITEKKERKGWPKKNLRPARETDMRDNRLRDEIPKDSTIRMRMALHPNHREVFALASIEASNLCISSSENGYLVGLSSRCKEAK